MRDWKKTDDEERVGRPTVEFLGRAEKEMQIGFQKLIHVFLPDFRQRHPLLSLAARQFQKFRLRAGRIRLIIAAACYH